METKSFENVSLLGRIAYGIMCAESYVFAVAPDRQWKPLFEKLWAITGDVYWDEWADQVLEFIPEVLFEAPDYKSSDFECLTEEEYSYFYALENEMPDDWNMLLNRIRDIEDIYVYTTIPGTGKESLDLLAEIGDILAKRNIDLPDAQTVAFSSFSEMNGRGNSFDAKKLSRI